MLTAGQSIRKTCLDCVGGSKEVKGCQGDRTDPICPFYKYRMGRGRPKLRIIREFCLQCMNDHTALVSDCDSKSCLLVPYRMGRRPIRPGKIKNLPQAFKKGEQTGTLRSKVERDSKKHSIQGVSGRVSKK